MARVHGPQRVHEPMLRVQGQFVPLGWDEAIAETAAGLRRARAEFSVARMADRTLEIYREAIA